MDVYDLAPRVHPWLACPVCRSTLIGRQNSLQCPADGLRFSGQDGILRLLPPKQPRVLKDFSAQYRMRRERQGWRRLSAEEMASLPEFTPDGWDRLYWQVRRQSYRFLEKEIRASDRQPFTPLRIVDMGAGIGWLAYHLATKGHEVVALDLSCDEAFGLGAARRLRQRKGVFLALIQGDLEDPPIQQGQVDVLIYNASLHYASDIAGCIRAGARLLRPEGTLVIMDTPVVARETKKLGSEWPGGRKVSEARLVNALRSAGLSFKVVHPVRGFRWRLRQLKTRMMAESTFDLPSIVARLA